MGIIRIIFINFLVFSTLHLSAQSRYDTVYFSENKFIKHIVQGGESLKSIAQKYNVTTSEIKQSNELEKRLFYNQVLYIPIHSEKKDYKSNSILSKVDASVINVALLMPYYLPQNDSMYNTESEIDLVQQYYNKSEPALSFHIGVSLAIDSLRKSGKNIVLHTFDTNQDSLVVKKIVYSNELKDMDIIIGPMYSSLFEILCRKYGKNTNKILISPLSRDKKKISKYTAAYQIALTHKVQADMLTNYLIKNKLRERIIILHDNGLQDLARYVKYKFKKKDKIVNSFLVVDTPVDSIRKYFVEKQNVLLLSKNKVFISTMLGSIGSIDSISTVFSFESIMSYDNLDITNLMELDVHIPNSRGIDISNNYDLNFMLLFEQEYGTNTRQYSKEGYDIVMHFCGNNNIYDFNRNIGGCNENSSAEIFHYVDYELLPVE
ncbi:MAG: hypothetical protein CMD08_00510 [Flavobacteriales bacterium]|nr:hypothetical protein [Flavobacteriales bacterium]